MIGELAALRSALAAAAPEVPMAQDEQGGCVWCGASDGPFDAPLDPADHATDCGWRIARMALSDSTAQPEQDG